MVADKPSRLGQTIRTEWSLLPEIFQLICIMWHQPQVGLFATWFNNKLHQFDVTGSRPPNFGNRCNQPALGGSGPLCIPTGSHIGQSCRATLCKGIILIVQGWPNMPWFWDLKTMSSQIPLCLPNLVNLLLTQPFSQIPHRNLQNLSLRVLAS